MTARPEAPSKKTGRRLLDYQALKERGIPWSRVHLGRLEAAGKFPMHIHVGDNSTAWFEDEVDDFLEAKALERDAKVATRAKEPREDLETGADDVAARSKTRVDQKRKHDVAAEAQD
jgi:prophage regulatory protein